MMILLKILSLVGFLASSLLIINRVVTLPRREIVWFDFLFEVVAAIAFAAACVLL